MTSVELKPIYDRPEDYEAIERELVILFKQEIYLPLLEELNAPQKVLTNSYGDLVQAIASGQIQFVNGHFEGAVTSVISRELKKLGAQWDRRSGWWKLPTAKLTIDMRAAIGTSETRFKQMAQRVNKKLNELAPEEISRKFKIEKILDKSIYKLNKSIDSTLKNITVSPQLTEAMKQRIAREYTENMQLYIKDWTEKEIIELRKKMSGETAQGFRYESMIKTIRDSYGVSQNKAKFLARQETSLLMTKYKQTRYQDAGVNSYKWRCVVGSPNHPVRPMHKALDGKVFSWQNPPIVSEKGERKNPGQDYGCRCVAIPIVRF